MALRPNYYMRDSCC